MNEPFTPFEVDLSYKHSEQKFEFSPIAVDLSYPANNVSIDKEKSIFERTITTLNEWADRLDVSILHQPIMRENGGKSLVPIKEGFFNRLFSGNH